MSGHVSIPELTQNRRRLCRRPEIIEIQIEEIISQLHYYSAILGHSSLIFKIVIVFEYT